MQKLEETDSIIIVQSPSHPFFWLGYTSSLEHLSSSTNGGSTYKPYQEARKKPVIWNHKDKSMHILNYLNIFQGDSSTKVHDFM